MHQVPLWSLPLPQEAQTYGIRHCPSAVQHRLAIVSAALRKSNYHVASLQGAAACKPIRSNRPQVEKLTRLRCGEPTSQAVAGHVFAGFSLVRLGTDEPALQSCASAMSAAILAALAQKSGAGLT